MQVLNDLFDMGWNYHFTDQGGIHIHKGLRNYYIDSEGQMYRLFEDTEVKLNKFESLIDALRHMREFGELKIK